MSLPPHLLITNHSDWHECLERLYCEPRLAIDLEANSLFAYREQVCLIQVTIPGQDYIVDPVSGIDLSDLGSIIEDPHIEKVFHAAEYDLILMKRQYSWQLNNLFDTMWAARILGYKRYGLASLLAKFYGATLNKRYQKTNWCRRPLSPEQLAYAQMDTHYLLGLRDKLASELAAAGCTEEAQEIFAEKTQVRDGISEFDPESFWTINGVSSLNRRQQAVAKALHIYRDKQARKQDRPLFKVFEDRTLVEVARNQPESLDALQRVHGMSKGQIRRYGRQLVNVVQEAKRGPVPRRPRPNNHRPPEQVMNRYEKLHAWRKRRATARGVESDVILSRDSLWALAREHPRSEAELAQTERLGPWRREKYGREILEILGQ